MFISVKNIYRYIYIYKYIYNTHMFVRKLRLIICPRWNKCHQKKKNSTDLSLLNRISASKVNCQPLSANTLQGKPTARPWTSMLGEWNVLNFWQCIMYTCMNAYIYIHIMDECLPFTHESSCEGLPSRVQPSDRQKECLETPKLPHWRKKTPTHFVASHCISLIILNS